MKLDTDRLRSCAVPLALAAWTFVATGCSITLKHGTLEAPEVARSGPLHYEDRSQGLAGRAGWGRGTVFAIPFVPIYIKGDDDQVFMEQVRDALEVAGYQPVVVASGTPTQDPLLRCDVEASFSNYTWLFPIVPTWGSMEVRARLVDGDGDAVWSQEFKGTGFTLNFFNGYTSAARQSMTEVLDDLIQALAGEEFAVALAGAQPAPALAEEPPPEPAPPVSAEPPSATEPDAGTEAGEAGADEEGPTTEETPTDEEALTDEEAQADKDDGGR